MGERIGRKAEARYGPMKSVDHPGVPADHFVEAPDPARDLRRAAKAVKREIARRRAEVRL